MRADGNPRLRLVRPGAMAKHASSRALLLRSAAAIAALQLLTFLVELAALDSMGSLGEMLTCVCEQYGDAAGIGVTEHMVRHRHLLAIVIGGAAHGVPLVLLVRHPRRPRLLARVVRIQLVLSLIASATVLTGWLLLVSDLVRVYHATSCFCSA